MSPNIWVYDIELSPNLVYAWSLYDLRVGINQIVEPQDIICFAAHKVGSKKVEAHAAWDDYEAMLNRLHAIMDEADYLVGYNQASFDDKHVRAAFVKAGMNPPSPHRNIDLLRVVKKQFKFPSHKLDYVCRVLGLDTKLETGGMDLWTKCLAGDEKAQKKMLSYNRQDVRVTTQLYEKLLPWIPGLNVPLYSDGSEEDTCQDVAKCTRCSGTNIHSRGWAYTTTLRYRRFACMDCGGWMRSAKSEPLVNKDLMRNL